MSDNKNNVIEHGEEPVFCHASIGISIHINNSKSTIENAFKYADLALYDAKKQGEMAIVYVFQKNNR